MSGLEVLDKGFSGKLIALVGEIKKAARGRTCGGCKHLREGWCAVQNNMDGGELAVLYPGAVACVKHVARV